MATYLRSEETAAALAAAVAGLLAEIGEDAVRLGIDGQIVGIHGGDLCVDGEVIASGVTPARIVRFEE